MRRNSIKYNKIYETGSVMKKTPESVVYGNFPKYVYKKSAIEKLNNFLTGVLLILAVLSIVCYYFVSMSEQNMNKLARDINALTNENIELRNKLDNLHSFNKVDSFIKNNSNLNTAKRIIEIPSAFVPPELPAQDAQMRYKWSAGY